MSWKRVCLLAKLGDLLIFIESILILIPSKGTHEKIHDFDNRHEESEWQFNFGFFNLTLSSEYLFFYKYCCWWLLYSSSKSSNYFAGLCLLLSLFCFLPYISLQPQRFKPLYDWRFLERVWKTNFSSVLLQITQPLGVYNVLVNKNSGDSTWRSVWSWEKMAEQLSQDVFQF